MSDPTTTAPAQQSAQNPTEIRAATQPPPQPVVVPPAFVPPSEAEINRLRQLAADAEKSRPFVDTLGKYGISDPGQLDSAMRPIQAARQRGLDLDQLLGALTPPQQKPQPQAQPGGPVTMDDVTRLVNAQFATQEHRQHVSEQERLSSALIAELAGQGGDADKPIVAAIVNQAVSEARGLYPQGHPMHEQDLSPLTGAGFNAVATKVREQWRAFVGNRLVAIGNSPIRPQTPGAPAPQQPSTAASGTYVPFHKQPREAQLAAALRHMQAAGPVAAPMSAT